MAFEKTTYTSLNDFQNFLNQKTVTAYSEDPLPNGTGIKTVTFGNKQYIYASHPNNSISLMYAFIKNNYVYIVHFNALGDLNSLQNYIDEIMPTLTY